MVKLSEKELSTIQELLSEEELLVKKFKMLADQAEDQQVKEKFNTISQRHQAHMNSIYAHLS